MTIRLSNNASGQLAASLGVADTTLIVQQGQGGLFPALPAGDWFPATIAGADSAVEIVRVTARNADTLTITRGQENTSAQAFPIGSRIELRLTAGAFIEMIADKLERSGGTLTGPVQSQSTIDAVAGLFVNGDAVWHDGNFDPSTKLDRSGNQTVAASTFEVSGENARYVATSGGHSISIGTTSDGQVIISRGGGYSDIVLAIGADNSISFAGIGVLTTYVTNTANSAANNAANSAKNDALAAVSSGYVQDVRLGAVIEQSPISTQPAPGYVLVAWSGTDGFGIGDWRPVQVLKGGVWYNVGNSA